MNNCYKIITRNNTNGLFENSIDATYIIYLEGNLKRLKNIEEQLANIKPTKKIHILVNKGWKKCNKSKYITNTAKDLVDCNITCFKHAKKHNYDNILILEDDFIFDKIDKYDIDAINYFLKNNIENKISFYFGTLPFLFIPYSKSIYRGIINIYTHSVVFTKKLRNDILKYNYEKIFCWDTFQNYNNNNKYYYYKPLCFQVIEETENSKNWPVFLFIRKFWFKLVYLLNANIEPKFFFEFIYLLSYIITISVISILLYILIKIMYLLFIY
tara:strand:+ start:16375 stop:17184 length:810 start_codon:yes stop_codon:yes gene_type:complete